MNILVTGGAGYIGSHTVRALLNAGFTPIVVDNFSRGHRNAIPDGVKVVELDIADPKLVAVKDWPQDEGGRYIVFCYKATEFTGQLRSSEEGEVYWVEKDQLEKLDLSYDMLPLLEVMEDPDLSEYFYRKRTDDGWEKLRF